MQTTGWKILVDSILVCLRLVSEQWGSFLNHLSCWRNSWTPTPDTDQGGRRPCGTTGNLKLKWDSAELKLSHFTNCLRVTKKIQIHKEDKQREVTVVCKKFSTFKRFEYISHCKCVLLKLLYINSSLSRRGHNLVAQSWKRKMEAITCCSICLEFWCGCLVTATARVCIFHHSMCTNSLAHSAIVCLFFFEHQHTSTCEHEPTTMCTQTGSHPHDHPEQHYHNLGN